MYTQPALSGAFDQFRLLGKRDPDDLTLLLVGEV